MQRGIQSCLGPADEQDASQEIAALDQIMPESSCALNLIRQTIIISQSALVACLAFLCWICDDVVGP